MSDTCEGCIKGGCGIFDNKGCSFYEKSPLMSSNRVHYVKILPQYYEPAKKGIKDFEVRVDNRDYQVGDFVILREWTAGEGYTTRYVVTKIKYILGRIPDEKAYVVEGNIIFGFDKYPINADEWTYLNNEMKRIDNGEDIGVS